MEKGVKVVSEVYVQQHDAGHAHMAPETQQSDDLPVLLHQIKELQDRLRLESLHKLRLQKIVMSKSQEATAAVRGDLDPSSRSSSEGMVCVFVLICL